MLRSLLFNILFYTGTVATAILGFPFLIFKRFGFFISRAWSYTVLLVLRFTIGTKFKVEGDVPTKPVLILSKHQSAWETIAYNHIIHRPAFILKEELMWIPFFGLYLKAVGMIALDRRGTLQALKKLIRDSKKVIARDRLIIMFPEGTRSAPGSKGSYKKGAFLLYKNLGVSVVPVALNSGVFWPRRTFMKYKGTITVKFLPPIPPGLSEKEFMHKIEEKIEQESLKLFNQVEKLKKI